MGALYDYDKTIRGIRYMRIARSTLIGTAVAWALFGQNSYADSPEGPAPAAASDAGAADLQEVVVTGIRASVQESLEAKRQSVGVVDVINAEDIGKMPDKNIADSLARVQIGRASCRERV